NRGPHDPPPLLRRPHRSSPPHRRRRLPPRRLSPRPRQRESGRKRPILPAAPPAQHTQELRLDPLTLVAALDATGSAVCTLYEDAGDGPADQPADYRLTTYRITRD